MFENFKSISDRLKMLYGKDVSVFLDSCWRDHTCMGEVERTYHIQLNVLKDGNHLVGKQFGSYEQLLNWISLTEQAKVIHKPLMFSDFERSV